MIMTIPLLLALTPPAAGCFPVQDDRIYGKDIAAAVPELAAFPNGFPLGYAPVPGARRILQGTYLQHVAKNQGVELESVPDVCFERPYAVLSPETIRDAMRTALEGQAEGTVEIEVQSWGPQTAPQGRIVFPLAAIQAAGTLGPKSEVMWRGYSLYGSNHRFGIWARARVSAKATRVVAVADIPAGRPIREDQVRLESAELFALDTRIARHLDEAVGFIPRNVLRSGEPILRSQLSMVSDVTRGDLVKVQVNAGSALLVLEARAQTSGSAGAKIWIKNPSSGKAFQGTVVGKGKVVVGEAPRSGGRIQ